jgi:hypothetical protein
MEDPQARPELYNLQLRPSAEDFEKGEVVPHEEGLVALPGAPAGEEAPARPRERRRRA